MTLSLILLIVCGTVGGSILYGRRKQKRARTMEDWALGGRKLGTLVFWFLNAGEIYTTFAVLGISGFAWAYGAPAYLAFCSVSLSAALGYWLTPMIHAYGRRHGLVTQADFFAHRYQARWLGVCVAGAGLIALVVYVQIQITALTLVVRLAVGPAISQGAAATVSVILMLLFVFLAGLRSAAFAAGVKDVLMLLVVIALTWTVAGAVGEASILDVFRTVSERFPEATRFPGLKPELGLNVTWLVTSAINVALGTYIFPHMFQLCYSADSGTTIRRNAVFQPIYSLSYFFIILLGFAALLAGTEAPGDDPNALLLAFVEQRYPAWMLGVLAGTASLLALVPGSVLLLTCGSIFGRNIVRPLMPRIEDRGELLASRLAMVLFAYAAIGMLAPGVYCAFLLRRTSAVAVLCGLLAGYAVLWVPALSKIAALWFPHWETGLIAMIVNALVTFGLTVANSSKAPVRQPA